MLCRASTCCIISPPNSLLLHPLPFAVVLRIFPYLIKLLPKCGGAALGETDWWRGARAGWRRVWGEGVGDPRVCPRQGFQVTRRRSLLYAAMCRLLASRLACEVGCLLKSTTIRMMSLLLIRGGLGAGTRRPKRSGPSAAAGPLT
jgi:hypothetical protein